MAFASNTLIVVLTVPSSLTFTCLDTEPLSTLISNPEYVNSTGSLSSKIILCICDFDRFLIVNV